jgi:hypothetical protein
MAHDTDHLLGEQRPVPEQVLSGPLGLEQGIGSLSGCHELALVAVSV